MTADRAAGYIHPDDRATAWEAVHKALRDREPYEGCLRIVREDGTVRVAQSRGRPVYDGAGNPVRLHGTLQDVTERKRREEEAQSAREAAEAANRSKDEFLAVVSHELRTPLGAILLWAEMLTAGMVDPGKYPQVFRAIHQSAEAQHRLIEDLLDVSRMLSGEFRLKVADVELAPAVRAAIDMVRPSAEAKGIRVSASLDERAGKVSADSYRVQQVVLNLLNNAVKFTGHGGRMDVALLPARGVVQVRVADTGRGIDAQLLPHVFERFRQGDSGTTRAHGGLGLGLAIARQLAELHGGTIRAESPGEGRGATFTLELPLAHAAHRPETGGPAPAAAGTGGAFGPSPALKDLRVLVVEDDAHTRTVVQWLLEQCDAEVTAVDSAAAALDRFRAGLRGRPYDALVSDIGMPGQDGYELMRQVRGLEQAAGQTRPVPAVALTAYAGEDDRSRALAAGFNTHVRKPVGPAALVRAVAESVGRAGAGGRPRDSLDPQE